MPYKTKTVNPVSGQRLKEAIKAKGVTHEHLAEFIGVTPDYIGHMCQGKRAIPEKRARELGEYLGVRPEYLLGIDDIKTIHSLEWLKSTTRGEAKRQIFLENCLLYWDYKIVETTPQYTSEEDLITDEQEEAGVIPSNITGMTYKIQKPTGETVEIDAERFNRLSEDLVRSVHRLFRETFDPDY
ncbi:MAG: helix-turn-helix transcriptional regulator [Clostridia bacterium]|nr:helix-turn-helix transcriptional regulator [Clostridia bacterium]